MSLDERGVSPDPEYELLLACLRAEPAESDGEALRGRLASAPPDWRRLVRRAEAHGVAALLWRRLEPLAAELPVEVVAELRNARREQAMHALVMTGELCRIVETAAELGIPTLPFKGPALAAELYGDVTLRRFGDLDLLLPRAAVPALTRRLESEGYRREETAGRGLHLREDHHASLLHPTAVFRLELHWDLSPPRLPLRLGAEELARRAGAIELQGTSVPTLHPLDQMLALSVHGGRHAWSHLLWVCDVDRLVRLHPEVEGPELRLRARAVGFERATLLALDLAHSLLGTPLSETTARAIASDPQLVELSIRLCRATLELASHGLDDDQLVLALRERLRDRSAFAAYRLRRMLRFLVTPTAKDRSFVPLPRGLGFLSWVIRPVRALLQGRFRLQPSTRTALRTLRKRVPGPPAARPKEGGERGPE